MTIIGAATALGVVDANLAPPRTASAAVDLGAAMTAPEPRLEALEYRFYNSLDQYAGWNGFAGCTPTLADHHLDLALTTLDASFDSETPLDLDAAVFTQIRVVMNNPTTSATATLSWTTDASPAFDTTRVVEFETHHDSSDYVEYVLELGGETEWTGTIRQVRFAPATEASSGNVGVVLVAFHAFDPAPGTRTYEFAYGTEGWSNPVGCAVTALRGALRLDLSATNASLDSRRGLALDTSVVQSIRVRMRNETTATQLRLLWRGVNDAGFSTGRSATIDIVANDSRFREYSINVAAISSWSASNHIDQVRIQPALGASSGQQLFDSISFSSAQPTAWAANFSTGSPGWRVGKGMRKARPSRSFRLELHAKGARLTSPLLSLAASTARYAVVTLANDTPTTSARIYWQTAADPTFDQKKSQAFLIHPRDGSREYSVDLSQNQYWSGTITQVALAPAEQSTSGAVDVQSLIIGSDGDTSGQNRDLLEGYHDSTMGSWANGWLFDESGGTVQGQVRDDGLTWVYVQRPAALPPYKIYAGGFGLVHQGLGGRTAVERSLAIDNSGLVQWEFFAAVTNTQADGARWRLSTDAGDAIAFGIQAGFFVLDLDPQTPGGQVLQLIPVAATTWWGVRVKLNLVTRKFTVWIDNVVVATDVEIPGSYPLRLTGTSVEVTGNQALTLFGGNRIYKIAPFFDDFMTVPLGQLPAEYTAQQTNGTATVEGRNGLTLSRGTQATGLVDVERPFDQAEGIVEIEAHLIFGQTSGGAQFTALGDQGFAASLTVSSGDIRFSVGAHNEVAWSGFASGIPYVVMFRIDLLNHTMTAYVNGVAQAANTDVPIQASTSVINSLRLHVSEAGERLETRLLRVAPYFPSTVPTIDKVSTSTGLIGVQSWAGSIGDNCNQRLWTKFSTSDKTPYLGYYFDLMQPEVVDWQVKWMAESGIDFITHFTYGAKAPGAPYVANSWLINYLMHSGTSGQVKQALIWDVSFEITQCGAQPHDYIVNTLVPYWVETFLRHPTSLRVNGQPVLFFFNWQTAVAPLGSVAAVNQLFADIRTAVAARGVGTPLIVGLNGGPEPSSMTPSAAAGVDYVTAYSRIGKGVAALQSFMNLATANGVEAIACPSVSWDSRSWYPAATPGKFLYVHTPPQFEEVLKWARDTYLGGVAGNKTGSITERMLLVDNFAEYGEGHSIAPSPLYGFAYLEAIRKTFTQAESAHPNVRPAGPYDVLFSRAWI
ncbi:hypothetical protein JOF29_007051 [Kribbella aluminosa]|uniref:Uncharacterized protein n=1 Tax=Kribbella aluminosa TaxID=416017 RepID=A0ABS4UWE3_9ACTN|nr:hypothetical protein [Kribbella aluminosa]MBP2355941.1 hypothetical protein [Kribbella aluminosa]